MKFLKQFAGALIAALAVTTLQAQTVLKFGHVGKPGSLFEASVEEFAKRANANLDGKAEVQVFGSSQLGKDKELLQKLKLGQVTFSLPSSVMSSVADGFSITACGQGSGLPDSGSV
jgi:TRAP-type C4-dicarboxylate transport system substrate-binding protein